MSTPQMTETQIIQAISGHEVRNAALQDVLVGKGVDLHESRLVECHF